MAALHAAAFTRDRPWEAAEFATLLDSPHTQVFACDHGFALTRTLAGESELLTLAVAPAAHRQGHGRALLRDWLDSLPPDTERAFLEVAADNHAAIALYENMGFTQIARRRGYYARIGGPSVDAHIMALDLTSGHTGIYSTPAAESS